jgi:hypothetical protein
MKEKREVRLDQYARLAVRAVLFMGIAAFLVAFVLNFKLVMGVTIAFICLGALGFSAKIM